MSVVEELTRGGRGGRYTGAGRDEAATTMDVGYLSTVQQYGWANAITVLTAATDNKNFILFLQLVV